MEAALNLLTAIAAIDWVLFTGLWVLMSIWDLREQKILHRHLFFGLKVAAVCYALMLGGTLLGQFGRVSVYFRWGYYGELLVYVLTSLVAALGLWRARIWPAGDAKLYAFLAVLFPMLSLSGAFRSGWVFLDVLVNIFLPASAAVFVHACRYIWKTRLQHMRGFIAQLGPRRELDYWLQSTRQNAALARAKLVEGAAWLRAEPKAAAWALLGWFFSMLVMALLSCAITGVVASPFLRTLLCFALMMLWGRAKDFFDARLAWVLAAGVGLLLLSGRAPLFGGELMRAFGYIGVFSLFLSLGMRMATGLMAGRMGMSGQLFLLAFPLMTALFGLLPRSLPGGGGWLKAALPLMLMGAFFGVAFVFVRIWDDEDHPQIPSDKLLSFMVLHRSFHRRLKEDDEDFYAEHFAASYADGLTPAQAEALRRWCQERRVQTVPLTTTMSFAHWIFLGYFITWLLGGSVLRALATHL